MRVLLVQPKYTRRQDTPLMVQMPLGLCYIAAVLRQRGHTVAILDCLADGFRNKERTGDSVTYGLSDDEIVKRIGSFGPDIVGCSALFSSQFDNAKHICDIVKFIDKDIITAMGGMHPTVMPEKVLSENNIDFILKGEADYTFPDLADALERKKDHSKIDGSGYKDNGRRIIKGKSSFIDDLDRLPRPARDLLKIDNYFKAALAHGTVLKDNRNANLITSRGCPAACTFCTVHLMWGRRFRARSPENVLAELIHLKNDLGVRHLQFEDDNLTFDKARAKKIFAGMIEKRLDLLWNTPNGVALWSMDKEMLDLMKKSGCYYVKFSVESGNQRVLSEVMKKPQDLAKAKTLIDYARSIGMKAGSFFVVGMPGETKDEMQDSFDYPHRVRLDYAHYETAVPYYGTELRRLCQEKGYLRKHTDADLEIGKGLIDTPDFSAEWVDKSVKRAHRRYILSLIYRQPGTLITMGWEIFKRNPFFIIGFLRRVFGIRS